MRLCEQPVNERGVALIVVLWIFIFLFVVAFDFSVAVREEAAAAHRFNDETQGYYLALAGFEHGLYDLMHRSTGINLDDEEKKEDLYDGRWREEKLGGGVYRVRFIDEGGKININRVDDGTLRRVFVNLGVEEPRRTILIDSILDWRDPDDLHRVNGAENDYYRSLTPSYTGKNGPFDTIEDLLWVRGMTSDLFYGERENESGDRVLGIAFKKIFTVDSAIDRINLRTVSPEVIHALMGMPLEKARVFAEERQKLSDKSIGDLLRLLGVGAQDPMLRMFVFTNPAVVTLEAEGRLNDSRSGRRVKGVVRTSGARGFELLRWVDHDVALFQN
ncbi:MAG: general secretion pathway protein GspK [Candidatus Binatia bacterium]